MLICKESKHWIRPETEHLKFAANCPVVTCMAISWITHFFFVIHKSQNFVMTFYMYLLLHLYNHITHSAFSFMCHVYVFYKWNDNFIYYLLLDIKECHAIFFVYFLIFHTFSAFWLRSSVVSVLLSLISETVSNTLTTED